MVWMGPEFVDQSSPVFKILMAGILVNGLARIPFIFAQSYGRPDLTAKLHVAELPFYLILIYWLISSYGIIGAAFAWLLRVMFDCLGMFAIASFLSPNLARTSLKATALLAMQALMLLIIANGELAVQQLVLCSLMVVLNAAIVWGILLDRDQRAWVSSRLPRLWSR